MKKFAAIISILILLLCSCNRRVIFPTESVRSDSIRISSADSSAVVKTSANESMINRMYKDSVIIRDSVFTERSADTVFVTRNRFITKIKIRADTVFLSKADTVFFTRILSQDSVSSKMGKDSSVLIKKPPESPVWKKLIAVAVGAAILYLLLFVGPKTLKD